MTNYQAENLTPQLNIENPVPIDFFQGLSGRRKKSAFVLIIIWGMIFTLYQISWSWVFLSLFLLLVVIQSLRLVLAKPSAILPPSTLENQEELPFISLLVSAKNEEKVIEKLVKNLCQINYPLDKYEVWIVDDYSTDRTGQILDHLALQYPQLHILHRCADATGGKCGALNEVTLLTKGDIVGVFDADAQINCDLLKYIVPFFRDEKTGAVQVRKAISNAEVNFLTKGQSVEMILDSYYQQQRIAIDGLGELRGNGQFVRRKALDRCGGWNEETITDDLDLTIRLHLDNWEIGFLANPAVAEEGVTQVKALWHQRNRWGEGGYQRYLDYWRLILKEPLGMKKRLDLAFFLLLQYILPTASVPDLLMAIIYHRLPVLGLLNGTIITFSFIGMVSGLGRIKEQSLPWRQKISQSLLGTLYLTHWLIIMPSITARMSILPKRLKWVKTVHQGE